MTRTMNSIKHFLPVALCLFAVSALAQTPAPAPAGPTQPPVKTFDLKFTAPEVDAIYAALLRQPYGDVATVIDRLRSQVIGQTQVLPPGAPTPPAEKPVGGMGPEKPEKSATPAEKPTPPKK